ncbi:efflux RND transporter permease subunit [Thiohalocapsa marina]|uniref:Efflux RND transporter permease subunit n=1 Tax=Thiohalocapsa marina TaxID=424902 RepID=A0A5M8FHK4_9GAMM|nr:efflux RND transporter permease subunit [Thiohalocapsa marina]KAA6182571.1 efflux RND transporter permease subunit [Thiohalocapsa marina]
MNLSEIFIRRPVMTTLVMLSLLLFGLLSYKTLPISNLPTVDFPTISVTAKLPGANPETMAASVALPLEKQFAAISGIDSMTSTSSLGSTVINVQFALSRDIDAAAQDIAAAIAAAMGVLPPEMPNPPTYVKVNPADMPVMMLALTSDTLPTSTLSDLGESLIMAKLSMIEGVGEVDLVPPQKYAVRVQVNPDALAHRGIGLDEVAEALRTGNVSLPGGTLENDVSAYTLNPEGRLMDAAAFRDLVVRYQDGNPVRVGDLGQVLDGIENDQARSWYLRDGETRPAIIVRIRKQAGANAVALTDAVKARLPGLSAALPGAASLGVLYDQSEFIRASVVDVQLTMVATLVLVVLVLFVFIGAWRATLIPSLVIPLSLIATFIVMALLGYSLNTLSLMALTLSIGFVVDDAIVVLENIIRRREEGEGALEAALRGSREIGFTVLSMTLSLAAVFIPLMFMQGILGRLFEEFAVAITAAILLSGLLSLTLTPMLASRFLGAEDTAGGQERSPARLSALFARSFAGLTRLYGRALSLSLHYRPLMLLLTLGTVIGTVLLFQALPKGFIPSQDQDFFRIFAQIDDRTSFADMVRRQEQINQILLADPDIGPARAAAIVGLMGDSTALTFVSLPPAHAREHSVDEIIARLRPQLNQIPGLNVSLVNPPLITIGSRLTSAQWQLTLHGTDLARLQRQGALMEERLRRVEGLIDVKSDLQARQPRIEIEIDRDQASALGLTLHQIQDAFYSAYGRRQVSTIYAASNYYYVILELDPAYRAHPDALKQLYLRAEGGALVPLRAVARLVETVAPRTVNHQGQLPAATISFNLKPGASIGPVIAEIERIAADTLPADIHAQFQGTAQAFQSSLASMGFLLVITLIVIYVVLGILYESFLHPLTILTSLPLAGFGALAALWLLGLELDMYAYVGIIMLIGIVKKNGIMMVDFALDAERSRGLDPIAAIHGACLTRFRPIMMTTLAALLGTLPIAIGWGAGGEARQSLGVAVVGGLLFSQLMTLFVTPVFYVYLGRLAGWLQARRGDKTLAVASEGINDFSLLSPSFPFARLLTGQFALLSESAAELRTLLADPSTAAGAARRIRALERTLRADYRAIGRELGLTRLLPLERADLHAVSQAQETAMRALVAVAARASLYGLAEPRPAAVTLADNLAEMLALNAQMFAKLSRGEAIDAEVEQQERLTEESDSLLLVALGELYDEQAGTHDPLPLLRWSHLLERLETAIEGAERLAAVLESLVIKNI